MIFIYTLLIGFMASTVGEIVHDQKMSSAISSLVQTFEPHRSLIFVYPFLLGISVWLEDNKGSITTYEICIHLLLLSVLMVFLQVLGALAPKLIFLDGYHPITFKQYAGNGLMLAICLKLIWSGLNKRKMAGSYV